MPANETSYTSSGVNIEQAEKALEDVGSAIKSTHTKDVLSGIGSFGGLFDASFPGYEKPVLVSSIDGVGTKTKIAQLIGDYSGIGHDIVNHCINDILCQGAKPLFFLDYFGCSKLNEKAFNQVVTGAATACKDAGCALIGGETAEMPGVYESGEVDVVGCVVGLVEHNNQLPHADLKPGSVLIGLPSNGLHTNGYSLARKALFSQYPDAWKNILEGSEETIGEALLNPHTCYYQEVFPLIQTGQIKAIAHITGGGIPGNLKRVLSTNIDAHINTNSWIPLPLFKEIQKQGEINKEEMFKAFNMGIGMILVVDAKNATTTLEVLKSKKVQALTIGELKPGSGSVQLMD